MLEQVWQRSKHNNSNPYPSKPIWPLMHMLNKHAIPKQRPDLLSLPHCSCLSENGVPKNISPSAIIRYTFYCWYIYIHIYIYPWSSNHFPVKVTISNPSINEVIFPTTVHLLSSNEASSPSSFSSKVLKFPSDIAIFTHSPCKKCKSISLISNVPFPPINDSFSHVFPIQLGILSPHRESQTQPRGA